MLIAALLGLTATVCLWWLYFENAAAPAGKALARLPTSARATKGADAYGLTHFLLIAGVIYLALGIEQSVLRVSRSQPQHLVGSRLSWSTAIALYGGAALYLTGRALFLQLTVRRAPPTQLFAIGVILILLPAARALPALTTLAILTAVLVALVGYEPITWRPTTAAR